MKIFGIILLLISFHSAAIDQNGVAVKILPDKLTLPIDCESWANLEAEDFSILYTCKNSENKKYFLNFRLNNIDIVADFKRNTTDVVVNESQFKSYTVYEITAKNSNGIQLMPVSYCTKKICLDLVGEYEKSVKDSITSQLQG